MDIQNLIATGLSEQQASAYALLIEKGEIAPNDAAKKLKLTRTNAYKVLDKLVELGLAEKKDIHKKFTYFPSNPQALSNLVAEQRNIATYREEAVRSVLSELMAKYRSHTDQPDVKTISGREDVANAYRNQVLQKQPIFFLRSRMDIPTMGFETMHEIRTLPARLDLERHGITPDMGTGTTANSDPDKRSNLSRTWVKQEDYTAPVEWSVSGSNLLIVLFSDEPHAVIIDNPVIAESFRQMWQIMNTCLRAMPYYKDLPRLKQA